MDRIAAIRQIEDALGDFETGETDLEECERRVRATVRTFATEFDGDLAAYRADTGTVVVARSEREARGRVRELTDAEAPRLSSTTARLRVVGRVLLERVKIGVDELRQTSDFMILDDRHSTLPLLPAVRTAGAGRLRNSDSSDRFLKSMTTPTAEAMDMPVDAQSNQ